ncbi:YebC/PmpR family DNA-binding transcriptional regulator [Helicobacter saguini]|uniref:Probable transcriptional regulatory protein DCO61_09670 n=1 Tax=Helicobacter saguini TaxID=1548018 RepID=A0A347VQ67_9HELI|nr:YebC/PmpR family DNA-binding transcriptional regulator [Helicobacter saguini]MWV61056.1 YebC/PmpR family DNA-binding transcriptional regulator [Helicobacter saguini]MWV68275.1 YebC/PmpR family DNA-binding transcriptional regulator [Helicobacter saguini]MWV70260.1 YebC/PmpR family DNA-binding transcriptional regulator [Helicobacter saguini]MWV72163.1 YebC/PmpR family DNA-binding transcriptional regulator [Helicobacter saguini]TLD95224.1 YebC/PmpR family DNA-binding transcriptional regulator 
MGRAFEYRRAAKEKRWGKMSKVFPKLATAITLAAKEGGADPEMNAKLRTAIANAKAQNMPKDNIEAAIKRASGKDGNFLEITYEGKAANGVLLFIECMSDNPTRTVANIKSYFNKTPGASLLTNGAVEFMFERKGEFVLDLAGLEAENIENLELELIDFGLDSLESVLDSMDLDSAETSEIESKKGEFVAYCKYEDFGNLQNALESKNIAVKSAKLVRLPTSPITLNEAQLSELEKLLDKIEEDDDVQEVYTNLG